MAHPREVSEKFREQITAQTRNMLGPENLKIQLEA